MEKNTSINRLKLPHIVLHIKVCVVKYMELLVEWLYEKGDALNEYKTYIH